LVWEWGSQVRLASARALVQAREWARVSERAREPVQVSGPSQELASELVLVQELRLELVWVLELVPVRGSALEWELALASVQG
jgi:hypothetical protein